MSLQLNRGELVRSLRKIAGFRGSTALDMGESVIPSFNLGDLDNPPYHSKVGGIGTASAGAVAAQFSYVGLRGASTMTKGGLAVVKYIALEATAAMPVLLRSDITSVFDAIIGAGVVTTPLGTWDSNPFRTRYGSTRRRRLRHRR